MSALSASLSIWLPRWAALVLAAAVAASASAWVLLRPMTPSVPAPLVLPAPPHVEPDRLAALLGASAGGGVVPVRSAAPGLTLKGVMAVGRAGKGVALIAVGTAAARPVRVGQVLEGGYTLHAVHAQQVDLRAADGAPVTLDLPLPQPARPGSAPSAAVPQASASVAIPAPRLQARMN